MPFYVGHNGRWINSKGSGWPIAAMLEPIQSWNILLTRWWFRVGRVFAGDQIPVEILLQSMKLGFQAFHQWLVGDRFTGGGDGSISWHGEIFNYIRNGKLQFIHPHHHYRHHYRPFILQWPVSHYILSTPPTKSGNSWFEVLDDLAWVELNQALDYDNYNYYYCNKRLSYRSVVRNRGWSDYGHFRDTM